VPPVDEVLGMPAVDVVRALRRRELDPLTLLDLVESRLADAEPMLNAVPTTCLERARAQARRLPGRRDRDHPAWLAGLPVTVKDTVDVAGVPTTFGSVPFRADRPARSAPVVEHLERRGALIIGKTNVPEFCSGADTANALFGRTVNPCDPAVSCGASSGGAAVSVAAHEVWCAHGEDTAGSVRIPAAFCGVVGLRTTPGLVPKGPGEGDDGLLVAGPLARSVADTALFFEAMISSADRLPPPRPAGEAPVRPMRVAFTVDHGGTIPVDPEAAAACERAAGRLSEPGYRVDEDAPPIAGVHDACLVLLAHRAARQHGERVAGRGEQIGELIRAEVAGGLAVTAEQVAAAEDVRSAFRRTAAEFFSRYDVLVTPTIGRPPWSVSPDPTSALPDLGELAAILAVWPLATVATMLGCPAVSLPWGRTSGGLPLGIQVMGPPLADRRVLRVAADLEALREPGQRSAASASPGRARTVLPAGPA
jgi:amidase